MKVCDFIKMDKTGLMYKLIDATKSGYVTNPFVILEADRNITTKEYGNHNIIGFSIQNKKTLILYID